MLHTCSFGNGKLGAGMSQHEYTAQFATYAVLASPIVISADLRAGSVLHTDPKAKACLDGLLKNKEILAVHQDAAANAPTMLFGSNSSGLAMSSVSGQGFSRKMADGSAATVFLNRQDKGSLTMTATMAQLGLPAAGGACTVRDLINGKDLPKATGSFTAAVGSHSAGLFLITCPAESAARILAAAAPKQLYSVSVIDRSLTSAPLLAYPNSSFAPNTLNPSWLPLPGKPGGGLFFRVMAPPAGTCPGFDCVGFVAASDEDGLQFPPATTDMLLQDGPASHRYADAADPRAVARPLTGEYFVMYQLSTAGFPGRHTTLSTTSDPLNRSSWRRFSEPMFAGITKADNKTPLLQAVSLQNCTSESSSSQRFVVGPPDVPTPIKVLTSGGGRAGQCLGTQYLDASHPLGAVDCAGAPRWVFSSETQQLQLPNGECMDVDHGNGPSVGLYSCHNMTSKDVSHQQWDVDKVTSQLVSKSAAGKKCATLAVTTPNDCGSAVFFPHDHGAQQQQGEAPPPPSAYAVATFGELRGGNLSLVSSPDLKQWKFESTLLQTRPDHWDNATLSTGPSPVRLSTGDWLLLYDIDNLWPVDKPKALPSWGRCALGWAILDGTNLTNVLARASEPLVHAELPWEREGATAGVVYSEGIKPMGGDKFIVYAGGGDRVIEAFSIEVSKN